MANIPCPRCGMLVELDEVVCPHCRTPRGDLMLEEEEALARTKELRAKRRTAWITASLAAGLLAGGAWLARGRIGAAWTDFEAEVERTRQPGSWKKAPEPLPAAGIKPEVAVSSFLYINADHAVAPAPPEAPAAPAAEEPSAPPAAAAAPPPFAIAFSTTVAPPASADQVRIHGAVYDLATALPVPGARVRFIKDRQGLLWEAITDGAGRYQMDAYKNATEAVAVMIEASGYRRGLLEDRDPPYRERSAGARADVIAETIDSDLEPVPLRYRPSAQIVRLDLVLVPLERQ